jgi:hypothetical protein
LVAGGYTNSRTPYNAIWTFNFNTKLWTWIRGEKTSATVKNTGSLGVPTKTGYPGPRSNFAFWFDKSARMFYQFGGLGNGDSTASRLLCDLWRYNVATDEYTWIGGIGNLRNGIYGTRGQFGANNWPGSRQGTRMAAFSTAENRSYIFGGIGLGESGSSELYMNDLWTYDIPSGRWAYLGGSKTQDERGNHTNFGAFSSTGVPPGKHGSYLSYDSRQKTAYIFGGSNTRGYFNDLWAFNITLGQWAWLKGSSDVNSIGTYDIPKGFEDYEYVPSARQYGNFFTDEETGEFTIIGGLGYDFYSTIIYVADVWKFRFDLEGAIAPYVAPTITTTSSSSVAGATTEINDESTIETLAKTTSTSRVLTSSTTTRFNPRPGVVFESNNRQNNLSGGAIIGIAIAAFVVVVIIVGIVWWRNRKQDKAVAFTDTTTASANQEMMNQMSAYLSATAMAQQQMAGTPGMAPNLNMSVMGGMPIGMPVMPFGFGFPMMPPPAIPEHLRCDKSAFAIKDETRPINKVSYHVVEPLNPFLKAYGEKLQGKLFAKSTADLDEKHRIHFLQEVQMLWTLRAERTVARFLSFSSEPAIVITSNYPLGHLDRFIADPSVKYTKKTAFYFISDVARTLNVVHMTGHALRSFALSGFYVDKETIPNTGREFVPIFASFDASLPLNVEGLAQQAFADVEVNESNVEFVAPEIFEAKAGKGLEKNHAAILKAADVYGFGVLIAAFLNRNGNPRF